MSEKESKAKAMVRVLYYKIMHPHVKKMCKKTINEYRSFSQKHRGEKCVIVANGPSLRIDDLDRLFDSETITFGMNRIYKLYDRTRWRPTYFIAQDPTIIRSSYREICEYVTESTIFEKSPGESIFDIPNAIYFDVDYSKSWKGLCPLFSDGQQCVLQDGKTVTYSAIQLAVYMGFQDIYLIGCDCNYSKTNEICEASYPDARMYDDKKVGQIPAIDYQFEAYKVARNYAEQNGICIKNATRGGMLEVFERISFETILENK